MRNIQVFLNKKIREKNDIVLYFFQICLMCGLVKGSQILRAAFAFTSSSYPRLRGLQQTPLYRESEKANTTVIMRRAWPGGPAGLWGVGR